MEVEAKEVDVEVKGAEARSLQLKHRGLLSSGAKIGQKGSRVWKMN